MKAAEPFSLTLANGEQRFERARTAPDIAFLASDYRSSVDQRDRNVFQRQRLNYETRYAIWAGQTEDGKKWTARNGEDVFPWAGASDARVPLIDKYIKEDVAMLMNVTSRMRVRVTGIESNDDKFGHRLTNLLRWQKSTQMKEYSREIRLLANYMLESGSVLCGVYWDRQTQLGYEQIDLEEIKTMSQDLLQSLEGETPTPAQQNLIELPQMILDRSTETDAVTYLSESVFTWMNKTKIRAAVRELRKTGSTTIPRPYLIKDRPCIEALRINEDVFIPSETTDIQQARAIYRRETLTETQLVERKNSHGWDAKFVDQLIKSQRGQMSMEYGGNHYRRNNRRDSNLLNHHRLFEVVHAYQRAYDENDVPGIYYTVFNPNITDLAAWHGPLGYEHGEYPFVFLETESRDRLLDDSRGYGEIGSTWQNAIKAQWDSRTDRTSIATLPPSYHPPGTPPDDWGPGVQIPTVRPDDFGFMEIPKYDRGSAEIEETVRKFSDEYFGRPVDDQNTFQAQNVQQELANNWMDGVKRIDEQILKLDQQLMPEEFYFRVVGTDQAKSIRATREEIQGSFDVDIKYNVADLDPEKVEGKLALIERALQMDLTGRVDRNTALEVAFEIIDPNMGERILRPALEASQAEVEDEKNVFARMMAGVGTDVLPQGQAYPLRLQTLTDIFRQNPKAQQAYQSDGHFRELMDKRLQQLQFQIQQRENARIGVLGA